MTHRILETAVAIVGAGPVGATLAALLGRNGMQVFIGEAGTEVYPLPRAAHIDHEVMRIFQQLGIVEAILPSITPANRYVFQNKAGQALLDFDFGEPFETGWTGYMIHQPGIETALRAGLAADPLVTLRTGLRFLRCQADDLGVTSFWESDDETIELRSAFLVGCDGAWSPVREGAGLALDDLSFNEPWLVLDVLVDDVNGLPNHNIQVCDPDRPTTYVVMGNGRRRFEFMLKPGELSEVMVGDHAIRDLLRPWDTHGLRGVERRAVYRFHALVAERWRAGRIFVAGDAAHQMPPFAGQGMCSGVRDAAALAWRLPLAGLSADCAHLLDSYQQERDPHVRAITAAAVATGRVVCTLDHEMAAARDAQMLASRAAGEPSPDIRSPQLQVVFGLPETARAGERFIQPWAGEKHAPIRMDDVLGAGSWLITRLAQMVPEPDTRLALRLLATDDPALAPFRQALEAWLDTADASAVLVRPDRYVFGTGDAVILLAAFAAQAGLPALADKAAA